MEINPYTASIVSPLVKLIYSPKDTELFLRLKTIRIKKLLELTKIEN